MGNELGAWPKLPPGAFGNADLYAGLAAGVLLLVLLVRPFRPSRNPDI